MTGKQQTLHLLFSSSEAHHCRSELILSLAHKYRVSGDLYFSSNGSRKTVADEPFFLQRLHPSGVGFDLGYQLDSLRCHMELQKNQPKLCRQHQAFQDPCHTALVCGHFHRNRRRAEERERSSPRLKGDTPGPRP